MSNDKTMTMVDARIRAETMARINEGRVKTFPHDINASQWRVDASMLRLLLAASAEGPSTRNDPTGAGDYDIVCNGCDEVVAVPHSWAECCAAQKAMVASLRNKLIERDEHTSIIVPTDAKEPLLVISGADTFELRIEDSPFVNHDDIRRIMSGTPSNFVANDIRDLLQRILGDFNDGMDAATSARFNRGDINLENQCYRTAFWRLAGVFTICAMNFDATLRARYGFEPIPAVDNDVRELAFRGFECRCECGETTDNDDSVCDECRATSP
jgi:hypothetical protein